MIKNLLTNRVTILVLAFLFLCAGGVHAQIKIGDNPTVINPNSLLELESSNKGLLLPRLALDSTSGFTPLAAHVAGMVVYNTDSSGTGTTAVTPGFYYNDGARWVRLAGGGDAWQLLGNSATTAPAGVGVAVGAANFWGTTDAQNLAVGTNGISRMLFDTLGNAYGGKNNIIANGGTQDLDNGGYPASSFMWGIDNVDSSYTNAIFGTKNRIGGYMHSNIIAGEKDTITGAWGWGNAVFGVKNFVTAENGGGNIVGGIENRRVGTAISSGNGGALFGYRNVDSSYFSSIVGGSSNILGQGAGNSLVTGSGNKISTPAFVGWNQGIAHSNAVFGDVNTITSTTSTANANQNIVAGNNNKLVDNNYAAVFGTTNIDSANASLVAGSGNTLGPNASSSIVLGIKNTVRGPYSVALGGDDQALTGWDGGNTVTGEYSFAMGSGNKSLGRHSHTMGDVNTATGYSSFAGGELSNVTNQYAFAWGGGNQVGGNSAAAFGYGNSADGAGSFVAGGFNHTTASNSTVFGGSNVFTGGSPNTWVGSDPTFQVGNGLAYNNRSNAFTVLRNGHTAIGHHTTLPLATLHVYGNAKIDTLPNAAVTDSVLTDSMGYIRHISASKLAGNDWHLTGNAATTAATNLVGQTVDGNFLGTTDAQSLVLGTNNTKRMILDTMGNAVGGLNNYLSVINPFDYTNGNFIWGVQDSIDVGNGSVNGYANVVFGFMNRSTAANSSLFGFNNKDLNNIQDEGYNFIAGNENRIWDTVGTGASSNTVLGLRNWVNTASSNTILGVENRVTFRHMSTAIGTSNTLNADTAFALGYNNTVNHGRSFAIGNGATTTASDQFSANFNGGYRLLGIAPGAVTDSLVTDSAGYIRHRSVASLIDNAWQITGNARTTPPANVGAAVGTANYWGTSDAKNLAVGTAGVTRAIFNQNGSLFGGRDTYDSTLAIEYSLVWGFNLKDSSHFNFVNGHSNTLGAKANVSMVGGSGNYVNGRNSLVAGNANKLTPEDFGDGNLITGMQNEVSGRNANHNTVGGLGNKLYNVSYASVQGNQSRDSSNHTLIAGAQQTIGVNADYSVLLGEANTIVGNASTSSYGNMIVGGANKLIANGEAAANGQVLNNANLVSGYNSTVINSVGTMVGGQINYSRRNAYSIMVGDRDTLYNAEAAAVFGRLNKDSASYTLMAGQGNIIGPTATGSVVFGVPSVFTTNANISNQPNELIVGGGNISYPGSVTGGSGHNIIFGGKNTMGSDTAANRVGANMIGGWNNTINAGVEEFILGQACSIIAKSGSSGTGDFVTGFGNLITSVGSLVPGVGGGYGMNGVFGSRNTITSQNTNYGSYTNLVYGQNNTVRGYGNLVGGGSNGGNTITDGSENVVLFGRNGVINNGVADVLVAGTALISNNNSETVIGAYNIPIANARFTVGNGTDNVSRGNSITVLSTGKVAMGTHTAAPDVALEINGTDAVKVPVGTTAERPATAQFGQLRYNSTTGRGEMYVNDVNGDGTQGDAGWRPF